MNWAAGNSATVAQEFVKATSDVRKSLGNRMYFSLVGAIGCAQVHKLFTTHSSQDASQGISKVLTTARAIAKHFGDVAGDEGDENNEEICRSCLRHMEAAIRKTLERLKRGTDRTCSTHPPVPVPSSSVQAYPVGLVPGSSHTNAATKKRKSNAADVPTVANHDNGLPLPDALVQDILAAIDSKTAARASAVCKQLRTAYRANSCFELSAAFEAYILSMEGLSDETGYSDGSLESQAVMKCPPDGSPACGTDLHGDSMGGQLHNFLPIMLSMVSRLRGGNSKRKDLLKSIIAEVPARRKR